MTLQDNFAVAYQFATFDIFGTSSRYYIKKNLKIVLDSSIEFPFFKDFEFGVKSTHVGCAVFSLLTYRSSSISICVHSLRMALLAGPLFPFLWRRFFKNGRSSSLEVKISLLRIVLFALKISSGNTWSLLSCIFQWLVQRWAALPQGYWWQDCIISVRSCILIISTIITLVITRRNMRPLAAMHSVLVTAFRLVISTAYLIAFLFLEVLATFTTYYYMQAHQNWLTLDKYINWDKCGDVELCSRVVISLLLPLCITRLPHLMIWALFTMCSLVCCLNVLRWLRTRRA